LLIIFIYAVITNKEQVRLNPELSLYAWSVVKNMSQNVINFFELVMITAYQRQFLNYMQN